jgi:hypothetical protein
MNYLDLINIKYSCKKGLFVLTTVFIIVLVYILNLNMYESFNTYGYVQDELLNIKISIQAPDMLTNLKYIKIGSNNYKVEIKEISDMLLDEENFINYQIVKFKIDEKLNDNQVFKIGIFYNEEKVYKKILKMLF